MQSVIIWLDFEFGFIELEQRILHIYETRKIRKLFEGGRD